LRTHLSAPQERPIATHRHPLFRSFPGINRLSRNIDDRTGQDCSSALAHHRTTTPKHDDNNVNGSNRTAPPPPITMKLRTRCSVAVLLSAIAASSAFSACRLRQQPHHLATTTRSKPALGMAEEGERDDYDDFFADYDPSQFDSYDNNGGGGGYDDNGGISYGGGGGGGRGGGGNGDYGYSRNNGGGFRRGGGGRGGRGGGGRGGGGRGGGWTYTRDTSRDESNVDVGAVEGMIQERSDAKRNRDFETADAIRDKLMDDFQVGIDDRDKSWRTGVSRSGSGRGGGGGRRGGGTPHRGGGGRRPRQDFGPNGHDYDMTGDAGPNASGFSTEEIHSMIAERLMAKLGRDFGTADSIQADLVARGVFVHDGIKEWRPDGVPYGDFSERRGGNDRRGNPGMTEGSRNFRSVEYAKSSFSSEPEGISDEMIGKMVAERLSYKMSRDFEKADSIREGLRAQYDVLIDDRLKMWSVGGDFGEDHNARRDLAHKFATRGYIRSKSSLPLSPEDEAYVQGRIDERSEAKRDRDFRTADGIREELLQEYDVSVQDKIKLWSVGGVFEEAGESNRPARGVYTRRGGGDLSDDQIAEIQDLLMERYRFKKERDFDAADAIRDDLRDRFEINIDDRSSEWRVDTDEYAPVFTGDLSAETVAEITERLRERFRMKRDRDYDAADAIRDELGETHGVVVDDRTKEWKVEASASFFDDDDDETEVEKEEEDDFDDETEVEEEEDDFDDETEVEEEEDDFDDETEVEEEEDDANATPAAKDFDTDLDLVLALFGDEEPTAPADDDQDEEEEPTVPADDDQDEESTTPADDDKEEEPTAANDDDDKEEEPTADDDDDQEEEPTADDDDGPTEEELMKLTIPLLKEKLREAGLPVSGKKAVLISRLLGR